MSTPIRAFIGLQYNTNLSCLVNLALTDSNFAFIQLYFQTQGPLARNRQYKQKQYTLKKTILYLTFIYGSW